MVNRDRVQQQLGSFAFGGSRGEEDPAGRFQLTPINQLGRREQLPIKPSEYQ